MRRLYWKIFFAFWLVIILLISTNLAVTWIQVKHFQESEQGAEHISELAAQAVQLYESGGLEQFNRWKQQLFAESELRVLLLNDNNRLVSGRRPPPVLQRLLDGRDRHRRNKDLKYNHDDGWRSPRQFRKRDHPVIWPTAGDGGNRYHFVILNPRQLSDHLYASSTLLWRIGISMMIVVFVAMLLSHYLVKPIRVLQLASRQLAAGDLTSRVSQTIGNRRDELGQLGHDFDTMAQKIQHLVENQQQLLRDVSHELRTPLARLRIALELARKRNGESNELNRIDLEAERINTLIDEIIRLVRLSGEQTGFLPQQIDLVPLLQSLTDDANFGHARTRLEVGETIACLADKKLLHRALENIIRNALKYSEGEVILAATASDTNIEITISDDGPGVDDSDLEQLFVPFFRTDGSRQRETGGYGLGLAIAARAIDLHQGTVTAKNKVDGGLVVSISLPKQLG